MKNLILSAVIFFALSFAACSSPKQQYVDDLTAFTEQVKSQSATYTSYDFDLALEQYKAFRDERDLYRHEFTPEEAALVDSCYRQLNAILVKNYVKDGMEALGGYVEEIKNLLEDIL